jgi:hypothetical protein
MDRRLTPDWLLPVLITVGVVMILALFLTLTSAAMRADKYRCTNRCELLEGKKQAENHYDCYCRLQNGYLIWLDPRGEEAPVVIEVTP